MLLLVCQKGMRGKLGALRKHCLVALSAVSERAVALPGWDAAPTHQEARSDGLVPSFSQRSSASTWAGLAGAGGFKAVVPWRQLGPRLRGMASSAAVAQPAASTEPPEQQQSDATRPLSFSKILVANRGEIACRVMRSARQLGVSSVAVFSEADSEALHVRTADEAVCVGAAAASSSYLSIDAMIAACKATGAQAVHPGYGFLSENKAFAEALEAAGIAFVGPPSSAIAAMGDKVESKLLAKQAGVNVIPGYVGVVADASEAAERAREVGYPVMIKASAGGGGKGMRIAWSDSEVEEGFRLATQEAESSFGDGRILIEKYVEEPRHIEIQLIADKHGNCLWLPERECSVQRRNQKVVEEAPSPFVDPETRRAMGEQAVALAKAVNYCSAGTVEFLVDKHKNFYFLEMNTRLQVEHPVTEAITGLDLVELMLRVADGQELPITQEEASRINGWAVESRVYAEDTARGFLPSTGVLEQYLEPTGPGVRCDAGVTQGSDISMHYDPMICKLVTHGASRPEALSRMRSALDSYVIRGPEHNVPFLRAVVGHPAFEAGDVTTAFIQQHFPEKGDTAPQHLPLSPEDEARFTALAAVWDCARSLRVTNSPWMEGEVQLVTTSEGRDTSVAVAPAPASILPPVHDTELSAMVNVGGSRLFAVELLAPPADVRYSPDLVHARIDGVPATMQVIRMSPRGALFQFCGAQRDLKLQTATAAALEGVMPEPVAVDASKQVVAPMPGLIVDVMVEKGQLLSPGDPVMVLEAMKMRNTLRAENGGVVKEMSAEVGKPVKADQVLVVLE